MNIHYEAYPGLPPEPQFGAILDLLTGVFDNQSREELLAEIHYYQNRASMLTVVAVADDKVIGCKLGYERKPGHFYSWLGCVSPAYRRHGVAAELMHRQHDWCQQNGYHTIRTQTYNQWRAMLVLNIRMGFDIIGTAQSKRGLTLVLEKAL